jgi:hypothetical protein
MGQVLAQWGTETLAAHQANDAVARVFRTQARKLLVATGVFVRIDSMYAPGALIGAVRPAG